MKIAIVRYWKPLLKLMVLGLVTILSWAFLRPEPAHAGMGGQVDVKRLELAYRIESGMLKARVHLITGTAIDWTAKDEQEQQVLLRFAELFSRHPTRMSVTLEEDRVLGYQISIP